MSSTQAIDGGCSQLSPTASVTVIDIAVPSAAARMVIRSVPWPRRILPPERGHVQRLPSCHSTDASPS